MSPENDPKPMDPSAREGTGAPATNRQRACWSVLTLIEEVAALFPEAQTSLSDFDARNTALSVEFDTSLEDTRGLVDLLRLVGSDPRVREVDTEAGVSYPRDAVKVTMRSSARTQDLRDSFGLGQAWEIMADAIDTGTLPDTSDAVVDFVETERAKSKAGEAPGFDGFGLTGGSW